MNESLPLGSRVSVRPPDRNEHSRTPGYVGDKTGVVTAYLGRHVLPSSAARGDVPPAIDDLFSVVFDGSDLFGRGSSHRVSVDLYRSVLEETHGR